VLNPTEQLLMLADKHKLSADDQLELIKTFAECGTVADIAITVPFIDEALQERAESRDLAPPAATPPWEDAAAAAEPVEMQPAAPAPPKAEPAGHPADSGPEETAVFFDRNLARHSLKRLVQLPADGPAFERVGYDTIRLVVPKDEFATYQNILAGGQSFEDEAVPYGEIVAGWYFVFADGSTGAVAIVNAAARDGGAFVDAFLIIQDGEHPTVPNPSLEPRRTLHDDFIFPHPDGTFRLLRLESSPV